MHLSKRRGKFFNGRRRAARAWHWRTPIRHTISKIGQNLRKFVTVKRKEPQSSRKCCTSGTNGKNCAVVAGRVERHTAGAVRCGWPAVVRCRPPGTRCRGAARMLPQTRDAGRAFFHGKLT